MQISGGKLHCESCKHNGPGKCDANGCPMKTVYNDIERVCESEYEKHKLKFYNCFILCYYMYITPMDEHVIVFNNGNYQFSTFPCFGIHSNA